jgi:hypothetical protein
MRGATQGDTLDELREMARGLIFRIARIRFV